MIEINAVSPDKVDTFTREISGYASRNSQPVPMAGLRTTELLLIGSSCFRLYRSLGASVLNQQLLAFSHGAYSEVRNLNEPKLYEHAQASLGLGLVDLEIAKLTRDRRAAAMSVELLDGAMSYPLAQTLSRIKIVDYERYQAEAHHVLAELDAGRPTADADEELYAALTPQSFESKRFVDWYAQRNPGQGKITS